jgi:hypothetical protein
VLVAIHSMFDVGRSMFDVHSFSLAISAVRLIRN